MSSSTGMLLERSGVSLLEAQLDLGALVARVADGSAAGLDAVRFLSRVDPGELDGAGRVDLIRAIERAAAMLAGLQQSALAAVAAATAGCGLTGEDARHEVGAALRLSPATAAERALVAGELTGRLPGTLAALRAGELSYRQAARLAEAVRDLPGAAAATVEAAVLGAGPGLTPDRFGRALRRAVLAADPAGAADRHQAAVANRTIERLPQPEVMGSLWATMPATVADDVWNELTRRAKNTRRELKRGGGAHPGLNALRVDALVHAVLGNGGADPAAPTMTTATTTTATTTATTAATTRDLAVPLPRCSCGGAQTAAVVLDLPTALGLADHPGELPGHGAIPGPLARRLAADRDWVAWTVDPDTRRLLGRGAGCYRPSAPLRAFIAARDRHCGFPGCPRTANDCDCDHIENFDSRPGRGGKTVPANLGPLCRQHHNAKTHGHWQLDYDPDTAIKTWTSPLGKTYTEGTDPPLL